MGGWRTANLALVLEHFDGGDEQGRSGSVKFGGEGFKILKAPSPSSTTPVTPDESLPVALSPTGTLYWRSHKQSQDGAQDTSEEEVGCGGQPTDAPSSDRRS